MRVGLEVGVVGGLLFGGGLFFGEVEAEFFDAAGFGFEDGDGEAVVFEAFVFGGDVAEGGDDEAADGVEFAVLGKFQRKGVRG